MEEDFTRARHLGVMTVYFCGLPEAPKIRLPSRSPTSLFGTPRKITAFLMGAPTRAKVMDCTGNDGTSSPSMYHYVELTAKRAKSWSAARIFLPATSIETQPRALASSRPNGRSRPCPSHARIYAAY